MPRKRTLFAVSIVQFAIEHFPVIKYFQEQECDVHVLIGYGQPECDRLVEACTAIGAKVHHVPERFKYQRDPGGIPEQLTPGTTAAAPSQVSGRARRRLRAFFRSMKHGLVCLYQFVGAIIAAFGQQRYARRLIAELQPDLVFAGPFRSCGKIDNALAQACARKGVPLLGLSFTPFMKCRGEHLAFSRHMVQSGTSHMAHPVDVGWATRLIARLFPDWVAETRGMRFFPFAPWLMLATHLTGLLERHPWNNPTDDFTLFFVEAEITREVMLANGFPSDKIIVAGKPLLDDVLHKLTDDDYRRVLYANLGLRLDEPFVLVNVSPTAEAALSSWEDHWRLFHAVMKALRATPYPKVLSLHPLCETSRYRFVETQYGYTICTDYKMIELYPYCQLVVSFPCSTNTLSLIFSKSLLVYDLSHQFSKPLEDKKNYHRIPGAQIAYTIADLTDMLGAQSMVITLSQVSSELPVVSPSCPVIFQNALKTCA